MTGQANQTLSFAVNMFYSLDSVRALPPFVCLTQEVLYTGLSYGNLYPSLKADLNLQYQRIYHQHQH